MEYCLMVWNLHNAILSIKVKVIIMEGIQDESWCFLSNVNYGYNEPNCSLIIGLSGSNNP